MFSLLYSVYIWNINSSFCCGVSLNT
jgi:hypothetical protein